MMNEESQKASSGGCVSFPRSHTHKEIDSGAVIPHSLSPQQKYSTLFDGKRWSCTCKHFLVYQGDCRHILVKKYCNLQTIYMGVLEKIGEHRDSRDYECKSFDEVIDGTHRVKLVHDLCVLVQRIALEQGSVCSDDLHAVTNELYSGDRIVGTVFGVLLKQGVLECVGRRSTVRRCAHGRSIGVYRLVKAERMVLVDVPVNQMRLMV